MNNLKNKLKKNGGFTLIEMLIVVAIIAILIAVSIPLVNGALEKSREATDAANERSFKAALTTAYLMNDAGYNATSTEADKTIAFKVGTVYCYNAAEGSIKEGATSGNAYGQGTTAGKHNDATGSKHQGMWLWGYVDANDGRVYMTWSASAVAADAVKTADTAGKTLTSQVLVKTEAAS